MNKNKCTCSYDDSEEMTGHALLCPYGQWLVTLTPTEEEARQRIQELERHVEILTAIRDANSDRLMYSRDRMLDAIMCAKRADTLRVDQLDRSIKNGQKVTVMVNAIIFELEQTGIEITETVAQLLEDIKVRVTF